jgi:hypothetical protein
MSFSIGDPRNPTSEDENFETQDEAEAAAIKSSFDDCVWAVWENITGEIVALVFDQTTYYP